MTGPVTVVRRGAGTRLVIGAVAFRVLFVELHAYGEREEEGRNVGVVCRTRALPSRARGVGVTGGIRGGYKTSTCGARFV